MSRCTPWGLGLLAVIACLAWRQAPALVPAGRRKALRVALALGVIAAGLGGVLLTITNIEIITVTSLGVLVGAVGVAAGFGVARCPVARAALGVAAGLWIVVGAYAAWSGGRVLYGRASTDRSTFVCLENPPAALAYLKGVRLDADLYESLRLTARELQHLRDVRGDLSRVLFGPTLEWLERAYPETILRGMPVWYDLGTSLQKSEGPWLRERFASKGIDRVFLHPSWESWPEDFLAYLQSDFRVVPLGKVVRLYERRDTLSAPTAPTTFSAQNPLALIDRTGSQIHVRMTRVPTEQPPTFQPSPWGEFFGRAGKWTWTWPNSVRAVGGAFIATLAKDQATPATVTWQIVADPEGSRTVLRSDQQRLGSDRTELRVPFRVEPNGRPLAFEITADEPLVAGWRQLRVTHAGGPAITQPPPGLRLIEPAQAINLEAGGTGWLRANEAPADGDWMTSAFETWTADPNSGAPWRATLELERATPNDGVPPVVMVLWCKAGRLEILDQFTPPETAGEFTLKGHQPEPGGMIGIVIRPLIQDRPLNAALRLVRWPE